MNEAKVTMMQRNKINYFLRQGSALPQPEMPTRKLPSEEYEMRRAQEIMDRSRVVRKRSLQTIKKSGDFEIERWASLLSITSALVTKDIIVQDPFIALFVELKSLHRWNFVVPQECLKGSEERSCA